MKNKILKLIVVIVIAVMAVFNWGLVSKSSDLSDASLANVEALALGEATSSCPNAAKQWDNPSIWYNDHTFIKCGDCSERSGHNILYGC
jgi:hypothetical protein